jgi:Type II CAAX prenyl endopeptidase Rce1-like
MLKTSLKAIASWPTWRLVLTGAVVSFIGTCAIAVCVYAMSIVTEPLPNPFAGKPRWVEAFVSIVIAPMYETLLCQWAIMRLLHGPLRRSWWFAGTVATLVFVVFHGYTDWRAVSLLLTSGTLAAVFAIEARRAGSPFVATVSTHGLYNCFVLLLRWS